MPLYTNLNEMLRDIVGFIRSTGAQVLCADDPVTREYGYLGRIPHSDLEVSVWWRIPVALLQEQTHTLPSHYRLLDFSTSERVRLISTLTELALFHTQDDPRPTPYPLPTTIQEPKPATPARTRFDLIQEDT